MSSTPIFDQLLAERPLTATPESPVRYPNVTVTLVGLSGSAGAIMDRVTGALRQAMREEGDDPNTISRAISEFREQAYSGNYDNLLRTVMAWVNVE